MELDIIFKIKPKKRNRELTNQELDSIIFNRANIIKAIQKESNLSKHTQLLDRLDEIVERECTLSKKQMRVYRLRTEKNLTYKKIAKHLNVSTVAVWRMFQRVRLILSSQRN